MATSAQTCSLPVDAHGEPIIRVLAALSDRDAAAAARESIDALLCVRVSVVAAVSTPDDRGSRAVVTVREVTESGVAYRTATALEASGGEAVGRAVLLAFDVEGSFIEIAAARWAGDPEIRATTVVRGDSCRQFGQTDATALHRQLLLTMPGPGTLAVDVADAAYRVLQLPSVTIACTIAPASRALERFDRWALELQGRCRC
jgi:hypothetical protein